ncbi:hypothetical protein KKD03_00770 [Patescibacteria group bacterium]|nr:hypothetical protein [Patescibacteria group bacterium]
MIENNPNQDSVVTDHVLEEISAYGELNASSKQEGDQKFNESLIKALPPLSFFEKISVDREGATVELYAAENNGRTFLVKKYLLSRHLDPNESFSRIQEEHSRQSEYFSSYIPVTVFVKRLNENKDETEYLAVQDLVKGVQFKTFLDEYSVLLSEETIEVSQEIKEQLEDILVRAAKMYEETGYEIDLDFFVDQENDRVVVFDTDNQHQGDNEFLRSMALKMHKKYGISVPENLKLGYASYG